AAERGPAVLRDRLVERCRGGPAPRGPRRGDAAPPPGSAQGLARGGAAHPPAPPREPGHLPRPPPRPARTPAPTGPAAPRRRRGSGAGTNSLVGASSRPAGDRSSSTVSSSAPDTPSIAAWCTLV